MIECQHADSSALDTPNTPRRARNRAVLRPKTPAPTIKILCDGSDIVGVKYKNAEEVVEEKWMTWGRQGPALLLDFYIASQARFPSLSRQPTDRPCSRGRRTGTAVGSFPTSCTEGKIMAARIRNSRLTADQARIARPE